MKDQDLKKWMQAMDADVPVPRGLSKRIMKSVEAKEKALQEREQWLSVIGFLAMILGVLGMILWGQVAWMLVFALGAAYTLIDMAKKVAIPACHAFNATSLALFVVLGSFIMGSQITGSGSSDEAALVAFEDEAEEAFIEMDMAAMSVEAVAEETGDDHSVVGRITAVSETEDGYKVSIESSMGHNKEFKVSKERLDQLGMGKPEVGHEMIFVGHGFSGKGRHGDSPQVNYLQVLEN